MDLKPFTFDEAEEICDDFEDLKDSEFTLSGVAYIVEDVVIAPFSATGKELFLEAYKNGTGKFSAVQAPEAEYDVMLVVTNLDEEDGFSFMGIRQYAAEKGVRYNFP